MIYSNEFVFYLLIRSNSSSRSILSFNFSCILVKEVGAAFVLPAFDVGVETVAVLRLNPEYLVKERGKLFERHVAVVDAAHLVDAVDKFHEVDGIARPLQEAGGGFCCVIGGY